MEQTNTTQPEASQSNLPFVDHFRKIRQKSKMACKVNHIYCFSNYYEFHVK